MSADADAVCGAGYGQRSIDRTNTRNGYRRRGWDTRARSIDLAILLREGSYFPEWLLERRRRAAAAAAAALISVIATSYLLGVSTRRMEKRVESLGLTRLSRSQVSETAKDLDAQVEAFRTPPLDAGPYTFVAAEALVLILDALADKLPAVVQYLDQARATFWRSPHSRKRRGGRSGPTIPCAARRHGTVWR